MNNEEPEESFLVSFSDVNLSSLRRPHHVEALGLQLAAFQPISRGQQLGLEKGKLSNAFRSRSDGDQSKNDVAGSEVSP